MFFSSNEVSGTYWCFEKKGNVVVYQFVSQNFLLFYIFTDRLGRRAYTALFIISYSIFILRIRFRSAIGICKWFDRWTVMSSNRFVSGTFWCFEKKGNVVVYQFVSQNFLLFYIFTDRLGRRVWKINVTF
jgi:hypothetical protein